MSGYKHHKYSKTTRRSSKHAGSSGQIISRKRYVKKINAGETPHRKTDYRIQYEEEARISHSRWIRGKKESVTGGYPTHGCIGRRKSQRDKKYSRAKNKFTE